tara:strand:+ start:381 stop:665 length:285 start_codon:yes stop_codon:yes gene_type:complete
MKYTVTKLRTRHPRKGELWGKNSVGMTKGIAKGTVRSSDSSTHAFTAGGGREQTFTKVCGIGKEMVHNLEKVKANARKQYLADRRAFVNEGCAS